MSIYGDNSKTNVYEEISYSIDQGEITFSDLLDIGKDIYENKIEQDWK